MFPGPVGALAPLFITLRIVKNIWMVSTAMKKFATKDKEKPADIGITKDVREKGSLHIYTVKHLNPKTNTKSQIKIKVMTFV